MGNYTNAYATVTPSTVNLSEDITNAEDQGFRYRAEQRLVAAEEQKKKDDRERKLKEFNDNAPKFVPTGVETEDEYMYAGVQNAANQLYDVQRQFNELNNKTNLTPEEERKLYQLSAKRNNLQNYPDNLKRMMESQTNAAKDYLEGIKKGLYLSDPNIDKKLSSALTGYVPGIDETGMPTAGLYDRDGDGIADVLSFEDVNSQLFIQPVKRNDVYNSVSELAKTFKADETKTEKGYWTTENKYVDEAQARATIRGMIDESAYKTEAHRRGLPLDYKFSDVEKKQFEDDLLLSLRNRVSESYSNTKDNADENADNRLAFDKKKQEQDLAFKYYAEKGKGQREAQKLAAKYGSGAGKSPNLDENISHAGRVGINSKLAGGQIPKGVPKGSQAYTMSNLKIKLSDNTSEEVRNIYVAPNGTDMWFNIVKITKNSDGSETETNIHRGSTDILSRFVNKVQRGTDKNGNPIYYKNIPDFRKDLLKTPDGVNETEADQMGL